LLTALVAWLLSKLEVSITRRKGAVA